MRHQPRKRFGQNFLQSQPVIANILTALNAQTDDRFVEIGPGLGALTLPLLQRLKSLTVIEIDTDLQDYLAGLPDTEQRLHLVRADALTVDFSQWGERLRLIGNLPYNISTPLLFHLLRYVSFMQDMHFMLQKEVVERIVANPGSKTYGRLSIMIQYFCEAYHLFDVPPQAFHPQPKVHSAVLRLIPHKTPVYPDVSITTLECLVARAFAMRRKTLANNLKTLLSAQQLRQLGIDPGARPEQISVGDYVRMADYLAHGVKL
ncbi:16S rRNA (adenine(1518)-N(6)/adenine(1519)-N(6))-dimethyltransferase RsmA [Legionella spiritensis]|uniref:Ribosomal RNA small subunit methyltransferase A n=1 Tax=Legionella spiritensis TaxID=452 RepID=A0A0W0ZBZ7_LEGSP|nr:16S rRNA (adenine(1518)-N(6)/adenine(1519)-N(6))-dimethyltransferase RsmA [Legionella spiritensis]KTD66326.1 dimethyladenosine transferase [Legionella spiritensis]SNV48652.1 dimethyladenosine transferase [Legionella spiritensis]VEG91537.1 dimethyladenosine transferase [Legionella spiritensis]